MNFQSQLNDELTKAGLIPRVRSYEEVNNTGILEFSEPLDLHTRTYLIERLEVSRIGKEIVFIDINRVPWK
jgi:hypothetical protein